MTLKNVLYGRDVANIAAAQAGDTISYAVTQEANCFVVWERIAGESLFSGDWRVPEGGIFQFHTTIDKSDSEFQARADAIEYAVSRVTQSPNRKDGKKKWWVRVVNIQGLESADYQTVYGGCPESFERKEDAQRWANLLNMTPTWPMGNPGYKVIEVTE